MADIVDPKRVKDIKIKTGIVKRFALLQDCHELLFKRLLGELVA